MARYLLSPLMLIVLIVSLAHGQGTSNPLWALPQSTTFNGSEHLAVGDWAVSGNQLHIKVQFLMTGMPNTGPRFITKAAGTQVPDHDWMLGTLDRSGVPYLRARLRTNGETVTLWDDSSPIQFGVWTLAELVYDGSTLSIKKDGTVVASMAKSGSLDQSNRAVTLGASPNGSGAWDGYFEGTIDLLEVGTSLSSSTPPPAPVGILTVPATAPINSLLLFQLSTGVPNVNYHLDMSVEGTSPGWLLPETGRIIPLTRPYFIFDMGAPPNQGLLLSCTGTTDAAGMATGGIYLPDDPSLDGYSLFSCFATRDDNSPDGLGAISNAGQTTVHATPTGTPGQPPTQPPPPPPPGVYRPGLVDLPVRYHLDILPAARSWPVRQRRLVGRRPGADHQH